MALRDFKIIHSPSSDVQWLQSNLREYFNQLNKLILSGVIIQDVVIGTSTTQVSHKLGRTFLGWHLVDIQGDARVWRDTSSAADPTKFLPLKASSQVTVKLWVF